MSPMEVAVTTDQVATRSLERRGIDLEWLDCTAFVRERDFGTGPSGGTRTFADVECEGETEDGRSVTVRGSVVAQRQGQCVLGSFTVRVGGDVVLRTSSFGDCEGVEPGTSPTPTTPVPPGTHGPWPTATVTVTVTEHPRPTCDCDKDQDEDKDKDQGQDNNQDEDWEQHEDQDKDKGQVQDKDQDKDQVQDKQAAAR